MKAYRKELFFNLPARSISHLSGTGCRYALQISNTGWEKFIYIYMAVIKMKYITKYYII